MPDADYDRYDAAADEAADPRTCTECGLPTRYLVFCQACGNALCKECLPAPCTESDGAHMAVSA